MKKISSIDYKEPEEQEDPARFSPANTDYSAENYDSPAHVDRPEDNEVKNDDFPANLAEGGHMAGAKRSQIFSRGGAQPQDNP